MHLDFMRAKEREFPMPKNINEITSLRIWYCKFSTLQTLERFLNLRELVVAGLPDDSLDMLKPLHSLRYLRVLHLPNVREISALSSLVRLESLSLATSPAWDGAGKVTTVTSLRPIAESKTLKHLELFGVCPENKKLQDLIMCKNLQSARFSQYPEDEVADFYRKAGVENRYNPEPEFVGGMKMDGSA